MLPAKVSNRAGRASRGLGDTRTFLAANSVKRNRPGNRSAEASAMNMLRARAGDDEFLTLTLHAEQRMRQRAVAPEAVATVLDYGREVRSRGASLYFLDHDARRRIARELGMNAVRYLGGRLDILVVEGDNGRIVTVSHRTERVRRRVAKRYH